MEKSYTIAAIDTIFDSFHPWVKVVIDWVFAFPPAQNATDLPIYNLLQKMHPRLTLQEGLQVVKPFLIEKQPILNERAR